MIGAGDVYLQVNNVPDGRSNSKTLYVKVLSVTKTHVNVRFFYGSFGRRWSISIDHFKRDYELHRRMVV